MFFQVDHLSYTHPGLAKEPTPTLRDLSFKIEEGEWVALIGANGSGKTTLARCLNALFTPGSGSVLVDGLDTRESANLARIRSKVGMVFQSPEDQIVASLVGEDTAFGPENLDLSAEEVQARVQYALEKVGMWEERERPPHLLSAGQIQRVALAGVLAMRPRCIIFDETTAMLDPMGKEAVLTQMQDLHRQGITVVMITHSMDEVTRAKRALLLDHGQLVYDGAPQHLFADESLLAHCQLELPGETKARNVLAKYFPELARETGSLAQLFNQIPFCPDSVDGSIFQHSQSQSRETPLIEIHGLDHTYMAGTPLAHGALHAVDFTVYTGKAHGLVGATGSGKSTLLQHLNGLYLPQGGTVRVGDFNTGDPKVDLRALRHYAGLVFQNPELYFFEQYVGDEIAYGAKLYFGRENLRERVRLAMTTVGLDFDAFKDRYTSTLSGGEKRKVALAATLVVEPQLLILDEPSAGLDPLSRLQLLRNLAELTHQGRQLVVSSHNMEDIVALTQEMTVMKSGRMLKAGAVGMVFNESEIIKDAGLRPPLGTKVSQALREKGWPIPLVASLEDVDAALHILDRGGNA